MSALRLNGRTITRGLGSVSDGSPRDAMPAGPGMTRREAVLLMGGAAAAFASGATTAVARPLAAPTAGRTARTAWLRSGDLSAVLDPARYGGTPRLVVHAGAPWSAHLTGATFPGTGLPADITLLMIGSGASARLRITMPLGGFSAEVPLSKWLAGEAGATSAVALHGVRIDMGRGCVLTLDGPAMATLTPTNWALRLVGDGVACLKGGGAELTADAVTISLASASAPSMFNRTIARRAFVELESGGAEWSVMPPAFEGGGVSFADGAFDHLTIECAETGAGVVHRAIIASGGDASTGSYSAAGMAVPLRDVRYARLLDDGSFHVAGRFTDWLTWMHGGRGALLVGAAEWAPPFEVSGGAGGTKVSCTPAVFGVTAPLGDVIAAPLTFPDGAGRVAQLGTTVSSDLKAQVVASPAALPGGVIALPDGTTLTVTRPDDLLMLRFSFFNWSYSPAGPTIVRTSTQRPSYIAVEFPPQSFIERAFLEGVETPTAPPIQSFITEPSRLAFLVPNSTADAGIPYTLEGLLDWSGFTHSIVPAAQGFVEDADFTAYMHKPSAGGVVVGAPAPPETSLEVPWGLYMSPTAGEWWKHKSPVNALATRTELWHTRLHGETIPILSSVESAGAPDIIVPGPITLSEATPTLRAVWARYYQSHLPGGPSVPGLTIQRNDFTTFLGAPLDTSGVKNRWAVVDLTGRYHDNPMTMRNMMLSSLGAWFDGRGEWDVDNLLKDHSEIAAALLEWDHRATMGRDHYVKIVLSGRLFPFGHAASLITITERKFKTTNGRRYAYLMQKQYIKVREPVKTYNFPSNGVRDRSFPFKKIEMKTLITPPITQATIGPVALSSAFWPNTLSTGGRTMFQIEGTDWDGNVIKFDAPLIYMDTKAAVGGAGPEGTGDAVGIIANSAYKTVSINMAGQRIAYAQPLVDPSQGDERTLPTAAMYFDAERVSPPALGELRFYPRMLKSTVSLETVERLTGSSTGTSIELSDLYKNSAFGGPNAQGMVFAKIRTPASPTFPGGLGGGLATPIPVFSGLGARMGAIGGNLDEVGGGTFHPTDYFSAVLDTELMGGITLTMLLDEVLDLADMPTFTQMPALDVPDQISIQYDWSTMLSKAVLIFVPLTDKGCELKLHADVRQSTKVPPDPPTFTVTAELTNFTLSMVKDVFPCVDLIFESLKFVSVDGSSPDVTPKIIDVQFVGALSYLAELAKYAGALGSGGSGTTALPPGEGISQVETTIVDSGPFKVDVDASGITASLNIGIPDLTIGVFSLMNMSFGAALKLPFTGAPVTLDFNFCGRENPFTLTVIKLPGLGPRLVKGGMIIRCDRLPEGDKLSFTVFIRIHGALDILGMITISLTFYLELKYETIPKLPEPGDKLSGTATLTIEIKIAFFSIPVHLSVTKELAGKDPRFGDMVPVQEDWDAYCEAFAPAELGA